MAGQVTWQKVTAAYRLVYDNVTFGISSGLKPRIDCGITITFYFGNGEKTANVYYCHAMKWEVERQCHLGEVIYVTYLIQAYTNLLEFLISSVTTTPTTTLQITYAAVSVNKCVNVV